MKKQKIMKAIAAMCLGVAAASAVSFGAACGSKKHQHTYSDWIGDANVHYQVCTGDGCTDEAGTKYNQASHVDGDNDGKCDVCKYVMSTETEEHEHTYSDWHKTETEHYKTCIGNDCDDPAGTRYDEGAHDTDGEDGACSVCGYKAGDVIEHEHTLSAWVDTDATGHYKTCTDPDCTDEAGTKYEFAAHDTNGTDGACSVCGYKAPEEVPDVHQHTLSGWVNTDATGHYKTCTDPDCTDEAGTQYEFAAHTFVDGVCTVCGYEHVHSWAEEFTTNENMHYYLCTAEGHSGDYKDQSAHVDADNDGVCDVCGFGTVVDEVKALLEQEGAVKVLADNFIVNRELPTFEEWGTAGIYQGKGTGETAENEAAAYVEVKDGKATLVTPNAKPATYLYLDFGTIENAVIEGYFELSGFTNGLTGYTPVQIAGIGGEKEEVFGLRANNTWQYRLDGGDNITVSGAPNVEGSKIHFSYDTVSHEITVEINGKPFVTGLKLSGTGLKGIKFSSGDGNNKAFSVDNVAVIYTPITVDNYKTTVTEYVNDLEALANGLKANDAWTSTDTAEALTSAKTAFTTSLESAETLEAVDTAYETYEAALLAAIKTEYEARFAAEYPESDYTIEDSEGVSGNKTPYLAAKNTLSTELGAAKTLEDQTTAYEKAVAAAEEINTDAWYNATKYTLTYVNVDLEAVEYADNEVTEKPVEPTAEDSKFVGWYSDEECTVEFTFGEVLTEDTTIYAKWHGIAIVGDLQEVYKLEPTGVPESDNYIKVAGLGVAVTDTAKGTHEGVEYSYSSGFSFGGRTSSSRYLTITLTAKSRVIIAFAAGGTDRSMYLYNKANTNATIPEDAIGAITSSGKTDLCFIDEELEAGTYYLNNTADTRVYLIQIITGAQEEKELTDITGTVSLGEDDVIDLSNIEFNVAVADGAEAETISAEELGDKVVAELSEDKTTVTIKYGKLIKVFTVTAE